MKQLTNWNAANNAEWHKWEMKKSLEACNMSLIAYAVASQPFASGKRVDPVSYLLGFIF